MVNVDISRVLCINIRERTDRLKRIRALSKRENVLNLINPDGRLNLTFIKLLLVFRISSIYFLIFFTSFLFDITFLFN